MRICIIKGGTCGIRLLTISPIDSVFRSGRPNWWASISSGTVGRNFSTEDFSFFFTARYSSTPVLGTFWLEINVLSTWCDRLWQLVAVCRFWNLWLTGVGKYVDTWETIDLIWSGVNIIDRSLKWKCDVSNPLTGRTFYSRKRSSVHERIASVNCHYVCTRAWR